MNSAPADSPVKTPVKIGLCLGALGIVFGDIGTSPLYTMKECLHYLPDVDKTEGVLVEQGQGQGASRVLYRSFYTDTIALNTCHVLSRGLGTWMLFVQERSHAIRHECQGCKGQRHS